jgi:phosphoglycerate dehydrogenase-like enzyme
MAEYAIAGALSFARGIHDAYVDKPAGRLDRSHYAPVRAAGSTIGIVGLGGIGSEVARLAKALGMRVIGTKRTVNGTLPNVDLVLPPSGVKQVAAESDFIVLCPQLTQETMRLIDADVFGAMKPTAVLINVSRGEVIDEDAMFAALRSGGLKGAVADVYDGELDGKAPRPEYFSLPNAVLTPHISTGGSANDTGFMDLFVENLKRYIDGRELLNVVDRARGY